MLRNRIHLVVSEDLKNRIPHYRKAANVLSFEQFFRNYLDPAVKRWKRAGVLGK
jgi:CO dehydrogenase/acetyl-CoA synthase beta subunit